jgi:hypothetical protein
MNLREWLYFLQTGHGRAYYRFVWDYLIGPFLLYYFVGAWGGLVWAASTRGLSFWFALGHLPPSLVTLLAALWVAVFLHLRPSRDYPDTLVALVRFWTEFRKYRQTVNDILHDHYTWTISVPVELATAAPAGSYPGIRVRTPPRCPKCNFPLTEAKFKGGWFRTCDRCNDRRISLETFARSSGEIEKLAYAAWRMSDDRRPPAAEATAA